MSTNVKFGQLDAGITLALTVPTGTLAGDVVPIGDQGLTGYAVTPIATSDGPNAPGLAVGQASVRLLPAQIVVELPVADSNAFDVGDLVYGAQAGTGVVTYSTTTSGYAVGYVVAKPSATTVHVFLGQLADIDITINQ